MLPVNDIVTGFYNKLLDNKTKLSKQRLNICKNCKLYIIDKIFGAKCNKKLYLNPKTDEVSKEQKPGFYNGCGCVLDAKTRVERSKCPLGKW